MLLEAGVEREQSGMVAPPVCGGAAPVGVHLLSDNGPTLCTSELSTGLALCKVDSSLCWGTLSPQLRHGAQLNHKVT